ncbi:MAG: hypothetical protein M1814_001484 [Vezdaea aestivalis]|nr:MAG: hypothetical protein M1814_001484 [Vezdaea aestivalis]
MDTKWQLNVHVAVVLLLFISLSLASPALNTLDSTPILTKQDAKPKTCGFVGDQDTYGLGIRLGLYFQWITTSLANNFVPEEALANRSVNSAFQLSTLVSLVYITATRNNSESGHTLHAVECLIVLVFGLGSSSSGRGKGNATKPVDVEVTAFASEKQATSVGQLIRSILSAASAFYLVWFIFIGLDQIGIEDGSCSRIIFFFAKVDLYQRFRTFLKVVSIFFALYAGSWILGAAYKIIKMSHELRGKSLLGAIFAFDEDRSTSNVTVLISTSFPLELVLFVLFVELTIRWNHISGVNQLSSTGQLLPFIVGASSLVRVVYKAIYKKYRGDYREYIWPCFEIRVTDKSQLGRSEHYSLSGPVQSDSSSVKDDVVDIWLPE